MKRMLKKRFLQPALFLLLLFLSLATAFRPQDRYFEITKGLDIFAAAFRDLDMYYVDSIAPGKLINTGLMAMTESLDPYTYFYTEDNLGDLDFQTTGKYGGVGIAIRKEGSWTAVSDIYEDAPMEKAGIKIGDIIVSLNGRSARGMTEDTISELLRGEPGTALRITVRNPLNGHEATHRVVRSEINIRAVPYAGMLPGDIGYIRMIQFTEKSSEEVKAAFLRLKRQHPALKGLVLDLRGNPGGLLDQAVETANLFIGRDQTIVSTRGKIRSWNRTYRTRHEPLDDQIPLAVLTDRMTASASEIVAGAVQDLDRGVILGQRSFGKGLVQTTRNLPYHTRMKLTIAHYYTPSGRCIQAIDYARHRDDGSVAYVPDSLKHAFKTRNGREVMDGGGIEPDLEISPAYLSSLAVMLVNRDYIFDYATRYYYRHPDAPDPGDFHLDSGVFNDFVRYLDSKKYHYKSSSEIALESFRQAAEKDHYLPAVKQELQSLEEKIRPDKHRALQQHRSEIRQLLAEEIMNRYYLRAGRIRQQIGGDELVKRAAEVLSRPVVYDSLLQVPASKKPVSS
ncbi:S41 family peptidase [Compostibacter hankyongensis]|uniref:S41 family peptidase n=1 Tax=Compostibacter hankyongensis TaxID=1007089 RepID=A0ABP8FTG6_9BACT